MVAGSSSSLYVMKFCQTPHASRDQCSGEGMPFQVDHSHPSFCSQQIETWHFLPHELVPMPASRSTSERVGHDGGESARLATQNAEFTVS